MKSVLFCVAVAVLLHCGQSRQLLVAIDGEEVKCENVTSVGDNCASYAPAAGLGDVWAWDTTKDVWNNETSTFNDKCCVFNATLDTTCDAVTCGLDRVKISTAMNTTVGGKLWIEAENLCCEPAFNPNDNCTVAAACPVKFGAIAPVAGQLVNVSKTDIAAQQAACCEALPACDTTVCIDTTAKNASFTPDRESARVAFCCEYPVNATCADLNGPAENGTFLNCSDVSGYDFPFTTPAAARNAAPLDKYISGLNTIEALDECCMKVKYAADATCAVNFNCTAVAAGAMAANGSNADELLADFDIVDEAAVAALCCQPIVEDTVVPTTVAAWIADVEACKGVDLSKAVKVSGTATLVANSSTGSCPASEAASCIGNTNVEVVVSGQCAYATFKAAQEGCADFDAVGTVELNADNTIKAISGVVPAGVAEANAFTVAKVEGEPKQVTVTRGDCSAKYILDDVLLAKIEAAPKNAATGKAASFLAAVLALLALLVL